MEIHPHSEQDLSELRQRIRWAKNATQRDRYRAVLLALQGHEASQIAEQVARSRRFVQTGAYRYRDGGLAALQERPRSGKPPRLSSAQRHQLMERIESGPLPLDGVCTLRGRDLPRILRQEFSQPYSLDGVYVLRHNLGYSALRPRPRHARNDPQAMIRWVRRAPTVNTAWMTAFLPLISNQAESDEHLVLVLDHAGWQVARELQVPNNTTLLHRPPYSPELNPSERLWKYLREHYLSNRVYPDYDALVEAAAEAFHRPTAEEIKTICRTAWLERRN
jgi:transposase